MPKKRHQTDIVVDSLPHGSVELNIGSAALVDGETIVQLAPFEISYEAAWKLAILMLKKAGWRVMLGERSVTATAPSSHQAQPMERPQVVN